MNADEDRPEAMRIHLSAFTFDATEGEPVKAIPVRWFCGDRVVLVGGDPGEWGFVTGVLVRPSGVLYQVSWPHSGRTTDHFVFELEDAG